MSLEHATLTNLDTGARVEVLFNPDQYTLSKDNNFAQAAVPGLSSPLLQFVHGNLRTLDLELFFDTLEEHRRGGRNINPARGDVRLLTQQVVDLLAINPATHAPPVTLFAWGGLTFTGVLAKATQHFTMFLETGVPVRARLQVTFNEWKSALQEAQQIKRQTSDHTRVHQVGQGETLSSIAAALYGEPGLWRPIALANQLLEPRRLPAGLQLAIPPLPYRNPGTGEVYGG
jgi:hypothetical protein